MSDLHASSETQLLAQAVDGDRLALQRLLLDYHDRLLREISGSIPDDLRGLLGAEDVLQEAYVAAFRDISKFKPGPPGSFYRWLQKIAEHRLIDLIRAQRAGERGGGRAEVQKSPPTSATTATDWLAWLARDSGTPSRSAARHELVTAVQAAIASLEDEYRDALRMRYLEDLPVAEVAARMQRTERAVQMLCYRGKHKLEQALESSVCFLRKDR